MGPTRRLVAISRRPERLVESGLGSRHTYHHWRKSSSSWARGEQRRRAREELHQEACWLGKRSIEERKSRAAAAVTHRREERKSRAAAAVTQRREWEMGILETWPPVYILQTLVGQIGSPTTHLEAQSGKSKEGSAQPGRAAPWSND